MYIVIKYLPILQLFPLSPLLVYAKSSSLKLCVPVGSCSGGDVLDLCSVEGSLGASGGLYCMELLAISILICK